VLVRRVSVSPLNGSEHLGACGGCSETVWIRYRVVDGTRGWLGCSVLVRSSALGLRVMFGLQLCGRDLCKVLPIPRTRFPYALRIAADCSASQCIGASPYPSKTSIIRHARPPAPSRTRPSNVIHKVKASRSLTIGMAGGVCALCCHRTSLRGLRLCAGAEHLCGDGVRARLDPSPVRRAAFNCGSPLPATAKCRRVARWLPRQLATRAPLSWSYTHTTCTLFLAGIPFPSCPDTE
jgi:hypothetical protein